MTRDEYLKELNKAFGDFKFFEEDHHYEYKGERVGISVTTFYAQYENEFNEQEMAEKSVIKYNKSIEEILDEWHYKRDFSCEKGTTIHEYIQSLFSGNKYRKLTFDKSKEYLDAVNKCQRQADNFYKDYKDRLEHIADEYTIGSDCYDIASNIDHLFRNKLTGGLILVDYKTNKELTGYNKKAYKKPMKIPLQNINDDKIHHYYIQLSIYKYLVEKYTNLKIEEMFIVYFSENIENYEIIPISYLYEEVRKILELRRIKNMKSIAVLLIGGSGTGKTCSFRNMPANETAIINVTNKPLPYKDKGQKVVSTRDYTQIISAIKGTKKRALIIDDSGYLMSFENFDKANIKSYDKFTTMAQNYYKLIEAARELDNEKICYIVMHEEVDEDGKLKPKAIGKMLNQQLCIEGLFTIVLRYKYENGQYLIQTKTDGSSVVKSPLDLFEESEVPNDLYEIDKKIREYYGFKPLEIKKEEEK